MDTPRYVFSTPDLEVLWRTAPQLFLCLDYDGTLVPIASRPEEARPTAALLALLSQLTRAPGIKVAIVSGRPLSDLCALLPVAGMACIGTHGLELRTASGKVHQFVPVGAFTTVVARLRRDLAPLLSQISGLLLEDKRYTLALHYRLAQPAEAERAVAQFLAVTRTYQKKGVTLEVLQGKKVVEVRPVGVNKGKAIQSLREYRDKATVFVSLGDDATDEEAFQALNSRGPTILVADPPQPTAARYYLKNPEEVSRFLSRVLRLRQEAA